MANANKNLENGPLGDAGMIAKVEWRCAATMIGGQTVPVSSPITQTKQPWVAVFAVAWLLGAAATAGAEEPIHWLTGASLDERLAEPIDVLWAENPLRPALMRLSRACRVAILIDRRVDPGQKLDFSLRGVPLGEALETIARGRHLGVARLGSVIYLGPRPVADRLPAVAAALDKAVRRLPTALQRKFRQPKALSWPDLATPREVLAELGLQNRFEIANLEEIPHDLWAAAELPPLPLVDRLTLVAIQFGQTFEASNRGSKLMLALTPVPRDLPATSKGLSSSRRPSAGSTHGSTPGEDRFTINVREKPVGPVLRQLAERLGLELRMDEQAIQAAGISLDQRVSVHLENATADEVFRKLLDGTRLSFHLGPKAVEIFPSE
ncbi:MAG: STN domain-containing protein [Thermoguttaceae bacterium]